MTPLAGIKVVELARILAGPWAGQVLADLGAEVVKVESPEGDDTRRWGPPFVPNDEGGEDAAYFHATNRGKRSVVADFATGEGRAVVLELVREADVLIENFKLGVDNVMWAIDYPYQPMEPAVRFIEAFECTDNERHALCHGNAERIFHIAPAE